MSLLCLDAMPSHARRHPPYLVLLPPPPLHPPACPHCALLWMIAMVLPLSSGSPHLWASRGEAAAPSGRERGGRRGSREERGGRWRDAEKYAAASTASNGRPQSHILRGRWRRWLKMLQEESTLTHTLTHTHRRTRRELTHCCRWAGECMSVCVCVSKSHLRKLRGNKC